MQKHESWLNIAANELQAARLLIFNDYPFIPEGLYFCQQSAEKSLKAYLEFKKQKIRRLHDLVVLLEDCKRLDKDFCIFEEAAEHLNPLTMATRYPEGYRYMPDLTTAKALFEDAKDILHFVENKIL